MEFVMLFFWRIGFGFRLCKHAYSQWCWVMNNWNTERVRKFQCDMLWNILEENCTYPSIWDDAK